MTVDYQAYMDFVEKCLKDADRDKGKKFPFRSRVLHTKRVLMWAIRITENRNDVDKEVLYTAAIFHDVGYSVGDPDMHQEQSARIFEEYANEHDFDPEFTVKVKSCVEIHSEKRRMEKPELLSLEQLLLMEADLLDEEGALALCWDGLACGYAGAQSYHEALEHNIVKLRDKCVDNPMVTESAKKFWHDKEFFRQKYIDELKFDLEEPDFSKL